MIKRCYLVNIQFGGVSVYVLYKLNWEFNRFKEKDIFCSGKKNSLNISTNIPKIPCRLKVKQSLIYV